MESQAPGAQENRVPAATRVYELVKEQLLDGSLADNELLSEGVIAQQAGVSRTPVREAFLQLESEGLLRLYPKRGALVVPVSSTGLAELYDTRLLIECHGLAKLIENPAAEVRENSLAELEALVAEQERQLQLGDRVAFATADRAMHRVWVAASANSILIRLFDQLRDRQQRAVVSLLTSGQQRAGQLIVEHRQIVDAIHAHDLVAADSALRAHLEHGRSAAAGLHGA